MIKQVGRMPKEGKFCAVWGHANSDEFYWREGALRYFKGDQKVAEETINKLKDLAVFFVPQPGLSRIDFDWPWQVEKWLFENKGRKLFVKNDAESNHVVWDDFFSGGKCITRGGIKAAKYNYGIAGSLDKTTFYYLPRDEGGNFECENCGDVGAIYNEEEHERVPCGICSSDR